MAHILRISDAASLAFHAMALLARHPERRLSGTKMAELFGASPHTLGKVMQTLTRARLVDGVRGANGGFKLSCDPAAVTLLALYELIEGPLEKEHCLLGKPACAGEECVMQGLMHRLNEEVRDYFSRTTLAALAEKIEIGDALWPLSSTSKSGNL